MSTRSKRDAPAPTTNGRGIRDWALKLEALDILFGASTRVGLAKAILGDPTGVEYEDGTSDVSKIAGSLKSWFTSDPNQKTGELFLKALAARLTEMGTTAHTNSIISVVKRDPYRNFYQLIPIGRREGLPTPADPSTNSAGPIVEDSADFHPLWIRRIAPVETASAAYQRGRIDQKFHYLSLDSAAIWEGIIESRIYQQYEECSAALALLCKDQLWRGFFGDQQVDGAVMLGCGAPSKDIVILESMADLAAPNTQLHYAMVDFSNFMLKSSFYKVDKMLRNRGLHGRVALRPIECDFLYLSGTDKFLRRPDRRVAWIISGGTIGNLNERHFFDSVAAAAAPGDLLVIGAETIVQNSADDTNDELARKYDTPEIRALVEAPMYSVWRELHKDDHDQKKLRAALGDIVVKVVDGERNGHSVVKGSRTVEVSMADGRQKIVLATSTRYDEKEFLAFAAGKHFKHGTTVPSPTNPNYKQFVFRFEA